MSAFTWRGRLRDSRRLGIKDPTFVPTPPMVMVRMSAHARETIERVAERRGISLSKAFEVVVCHSGAVNPSDG